MKEELKKRIACLLLLVVLEHTNIEDADYSLIQYVSTANVNTTSSAHLLPSHVRKKMDCNTVKGILN